MEEVMQYGPIKFTDENKRTVNMLENCGAIQYRQAREIGWQKSNEIKKDKLEVLHLEKARPFATAQPRTDWLVQLCGKGPWDSGGQQAA